MANGSAGSYPQNRPIIMDIIRELNPKSVLDLGVGTGYYGEMIRREFPDIKLDGVEVWDYKNDRWNNYNKIFRRDIKEQEMAGYDLYLMVDVIEHMSKKDGFLLLDRLDGQVLVSTPYDFEQENMENPYQNHISKWTVDDFRKYKIMDYSNYLSVIVLIDKRNDN